MLKSIIKALSDFWNLSNSKFYQKYILPLFAVFFSWGFIAHLLQMTYDGKSLIANKGSVKYISVVREDGYKSNYYYPLRIRLNKSSNEFRLIDIYKGHFPMLLETINAGDTITIYFRHKWQALLGWGKQFDIYQIEKDGIILFNLEKVTKRYRHLTILFFAVSVILWCWYYYFRKSQ